MVALRLVEPDPVGLSSRRTLRGIVVAIRALLRRTFRRRERPLTILDLLEPAPTSFANASPTRPDHSRHRAMKVR